MAQSHKQQWRAFTLLELLVVIAAIALLISLLLPALGAAQETGRASLCASNIRQLAVANQVYAIDFDEHYVPAAEDLFVGLGGTKRWHGQRNSPGISANPQDNMFDPLRSPLQGYMDDQGRVKLCPSFIVALRDPAPGAFEAGGGGYGYNHQYIGGRSDLYGFGPQALQTTAATHDPARPGRTIMFTDTAFPLVSSGRFSLIEYSFCEPPYWQIAPGPPSSNPTDPSIHFRHKDSTNSAWVDGHVTLEMMSFTRASQVYSISQTQMRQLKLGWFARPDNALFDLQ